MSDDTPSEKLPAAAEPIALRREALLPSERSRGLGTVAVVCTMAGVASGLALATTLMAMQVADTMSARSACSYRQTVATDNGFLGIRYQFQRGAAHVETIIPGTPAEAIGMRPGDLVLAVDGNKIDSGDELQDLIYNARPGSTPTILVRRGSEQFLAKPRLAAWPAVVY